jgi:ribosome-associated protein
MAHVIVDALEEKKGENILLMDIREIADFTDYFIICSGSSDRMLQALADAAIEKVKSQYGQRGRIEGLPQDGWLLIDFGDAIVHLFSPDRRNYYRLEDLWAKGKVILRLQ